MVAKTKQPKEEIALIKARKEMNLAWIKLDNAISTYNWYLLNKAKKHKKRIIHDKKCSICNSKFESNRSDAKFCSDSCRSLNNRTNQ
jgi:formylmethanofuran dehydrogenase subunit E